MKTLILKRWFVLSSLLVLSGPVALAQSAGPGSAVNLDGASGYAQVTNGVWFSGDFTIEGWVYVRSYNNWSRLMDFGNGPDTDNVYLALTAGTGGFPAMGVFTNNGTPVLFAGSKLPLGQWTHLAATLSGTTGTIYINGVNVGSRTLNLPSNIIRTNNYIGRSNYSQDGNANAVFDELRIWNVARTQSQIQANMHRSLIGNESGLVGYWRMDENTGTSLSDSSGHGQTATLFGGTSWSNSTVPIVAGAGSALNFNATSAQAVNIPHQAALNAYPLTVMAWFQAPNTGGGGALVNKYVSSSFAGYQLFMAGGDLQGWYIRDSDNNVFSGGPLDAGAVNDGLWHHAAMAIDATGGRLYLDGVLKSSLPWTGTPGPVTTTQPLNLALYPGDSFFTGQIGEVSVWNTALSAAQIQAAMNHPLTGSETGLLGYWPMDEASGTNVYDFSGHTNTGTLFNNPARVVSGANFVMPDPGYGISLTGTNSEYVQLPNGVWFTNDFTVEGWVYCRSYNNWSRLFDFGNAGYLQEVYMALSGGTGGYPTMGIFINGNNNLVSSPQQLPLNQWTHLATTLSGNTATIYMNGNAVGTGTVLVPGSFVRTNNYIGRSLFGGDAYANAVFDEVRIWNVARSATQIQQTMNGALTGREAGLLAYYRMDEGTGTNLVDATGNGMTGTLVNNPVWRLANEPLRTLSVYSLGTTSLLEGPAAGTNGVTLAVNPETVAWTAAANASWLHLSAANQSGTGSTNIVFTFDANTGATRVGTLTIGGQTLTISQAGATYLRAAPVSLVTTGLSNPTGVALDSGGNVYIADNGHSAIKKWTATSNAVSTLISLPGPSQNPWGVAVDGAGIVYFGLEHYGTVYQWTPANSNLTAIMDQPPASAFGVAVDGAGNVYVADGQSSIREWKASDGSVTSVGTGLTNPYGVAVDGAGNAYFTDGGNSALRKWSVASNTVSTLVSSGLNNPRGLALDQAGNIYIAGYFDLAVEEWSVALGSLKKLVSSGLVLPAGVAVDGAGNVYIADTSHGAIKELPHAFVDAAVKTESAAAGIDFLSTVLPVTANMSGALSPTSDQPWLTIGTIANGIVSFSLTANTGASRTAHITLFGVSITVNQAGAATPPLLTGAKMLSNGAFQFSFTNNPGGTFTVITTTNVSLPFSQWTVAGVATNVAAGIFQFTSGPATNGPRRFYSVRSP
jgi:sugar lactone lactonase YvrE